MTMPASDNTMTCGNCWFFYSLGQNGICKRYPPVAVVFESRPATIRPETASADVCGEWKPDPQTNQKLLQRAALAGAIIPGSN